VALLQTGLDSLPHVMWCQ